jgi:hypothetical protein
VVHARTLTNNGDDLVYVQKGERGKELEEGIGEIGSGINNASLCNKTLCEYMKFERYGRFSDDGGVVR